MANALLQARNAGSQAILTYAIGPELAELANTMTRMDWKVPIIGSWTLSMSTSSIMPAPMARARAWCKAIFRPKTTHPGGAIFWMATSGCSTPAAFRHRLGGTRL
jgi:branched-chain amino acid transport system substrate-binding protein